MSSPAPMLALFEGGAITRYHTKQVLRPQTVQSHSWRMAAILQVVWPDASADMIRATLFHDVSERVTGDMPSPVKWNNPVLKKELNRITNQEEERLNIRFDLTAEEQQLLKWLDSLEGALYCLDEVQMGNRKLRSTFQRYVTAIGDLRIIKDVDNDRRTIMAALLAHTTASYNGIFNHQDERD